MGYRSHILRIPIIILNCNNTDQENFETCCHELDIIVVGMTLIRKP